MKGTEAPCASATDAISSQSVLTIKLSKILELQEFRPYIRGLSVWVGFKQAKVYYERSERFSGKSQIPLFSSGPINEMIAGITSY